MGEKRSQVVTSEVAGGVGSVGVQSRVVIVGVLRVNGAPPKRRGKSAV